jgi:hypothetical protein
MLCSLEVIQGLVRIQGLGLICPTRVEQYLTHCPVICEEQLLLHYLLTCQLFVSCRSVRVNFVLSEGQFLCCSQALALIPGAPMGSCNFSWICPTLYRSIP